MDGTSANGACLCGAVRFEVGLPANWVAHCHCTMCQRAHGAAFVTWVSVDAGTARLIDPDACLVFHRSSPEAERGFCRRCGSSLFFRSSRWPGELHVARANVSTPLEQQPSEHAFFDTHVGWVPFDDGLPKTFDG